MHRLSSFLQSIRHHAGKKRVGEPDVMSKQLTNRLSLFKQQKGNNQATSFPECEQ